MTELHARTILVNELNTPIGDVLVASSARCRRSADDLAADDNVHGSLEDLSDVNVTTRRLSCR